MPTKKKGKNKATGDYGNVGANAAASYSQASLDPPQKKDHEGNEAPAV
jgi:hypothetical protein